MVVEAQRYCHDVEDKEDDIEKKEDDADSFEAVESERYYVCIDWVSSLTGFGYLVT